MAGWRRSWLEVAARGPGCEGAASLTEAGRYDEAEEALAGVAADEPARIVVRARLEMCRGDFLSALRRLREGAPEDRCGRARVLAALGRHDQAFACLEGVAGPVAALVRAQVHLLAGEAGPASVSLPRDLGQPPAGGGWALAEWGIRRSEWLLAGGEVAFEAGRPRESLLALGQARRMATRVGCPSLEARALARLGEAHAGAGNRWRALRAVTRAVELADRGRVEAACLPAVHLRAYAVYREYEHPALAAATLEAGHRTVVRLASGIEDHDYRESFFLDNRDCQQLVGAWKGDPAWGRGLLG